MKRREFIGTLGTAALVAAPSRLQSGTPPKTHIVSLSFDDGFKKSFVRIAQIYEKFGLSGCFNIIASAHMPNNQVRDDYMKQEQFGDFGIWNELQDRGHEIMPHGYQPRPPFEPADRPGERPDHQVPGCLLERAAGIRSKKVAVQFPV